MFCPKPSLNYSELIKALPDEPLERLQRFGVEPGTQAGLVCDGVVGPKTRGARFLNPLAFQSAQTFFASSEAASLDPNGKAYQFHRLSGVYIHPIAVAAFEDAWAMKGETHGNNRGPYISEVYEDTNPLAQQGPWCGVAGRRWIRAAYPDALPNKRHAYMAKGLSGRMQRIRDASQIRSGDQLTSHRMVGGTYDNMNGHAATCVLVEGDIVWAIEGNVTVLRRPSKVDGVATRRYLISKGLISSTGAPLFAVARWQL